MTGRLVQRSPETRVDRERERVVASGMGIFPLRLAASDPVAMVLSRFCPQIASAAVVMFEESAAVVVVLKNVPIADVSAAVAALASGAPVPSPAATRATMTPRLGLTTGAWLAAGAGEAFPPL